MSISQKIISEKLEKCRKKVTDEDARRLFADKEKQNIAKSKASRLGLTEDIKLLWDFITDVFNGKYRNVPWRMVTAIVAAVAYLISPFDLVPDFILGLGLLDDAAMLALVMSLFKNELDRYREWRDSPEGRLIRNCCD